MTNKLHLYIASIVRHNNSWMQLCMGMVINVLMDMHVFQAEQMFQTKLGDAALQCTVAVYGLVLHICRCAIMGLIS